MTWSSYTYVILKSSHIFRTGGGGGWVGKGRKGGGKGMAHPSPWSQLRTRADFCCFCCCCWFCASRDRLHPPPCPPNGENSTVIHVYVYMYKC